METREEAEELLRKMSACRPKAFFNKIDESQRGIDLALIYLSEADGMVIAGDLARELNVSTARIAILLKKMEDKSLIIRRRSDSDARQIVVEITPKGLEHVQKMREQLLARTELLLEKVGKKDLDEFIRISHKIREALDE